MYKVMICNVVPQNRNVGTLLPGTAVLSLRNIHIIAQTKASTNKNTHKNQGLIFFINNLITSRLKKTAEKNARIMQIISKISFCW